MLGLGAKTQDASLYLRYDGDLAGASTNHVLNASVRYVWSGVRCARYWPTLLQRGVASRVYRREYSSRRG